LQAAGRPGRGRSGQGVDGAAWDPRNMNEVSILRESACLRHGRVLAVSMYVRHDGHSP
jgi:hypothetical protein